MPSIPHFLTRKKKSSSGDEHHPNLTKSSSLDSTLSETLSETNDDESSRSSHFSSSNPRHKGNYPLINTLLKDATDFEKVLYHSGCINKKGVCPKGSTGFADLVARDLDQSEKAKVDRDAQIMATRKSWMHPVHRDSITNTDRLDRDRVASRGEGAEPTDAETTSTSTDTSTETSGTDATSLTSVTSDMPVLDMPHIYRASSEKMEALDKLNPDDIIGILEREFGVLASPDEPEKLLLETDGCFLYGIAVVGVIHLTTHRLTFHASLLATRPDIAEPVLRSGSGIMHRQGLRAKQRVWFELTHDMLSVYTSSKEDDKIRPLSTLLLAHIDYIYPEDPRHPRFVKLEVKPFARMKNDYAELESVESARTWRREITAAVFAYRHQRKDILSNNSPETNGVKISIPLHRIVDVQAGPCGDDIPSLVSIRVALSASDAEDEFEGEDMPESESFAIGPATEVPVWDNYLDVMIQNAKKRRSAAQSPDQSAAIVDFGPYTIIPSATVHPSTGTIDQESAIRVALGIPRGVELWFTRARLKRTVMCTGYFVITPISIGFWCQNVTQRDLRYRVPIDIVKHITKFRWNFLGVEGLSLGITGRSDLKVVFKTSVARDEAYTRLSAALDHGHATTFTPTFTEALTESPAGTGTLVPATPTQEVESIDPIDMFAPISRSVAATSAVASSHPERPSGLPKVINIPPQMLIHNRELHFVCLTIGSRGDVQPYIALGIGLKNEGHRVTIVTHDEYKEWIEKFGIGHRPAGGDPAALMKLSVENKMFSPDFFRESLSNFRPWLDALLKDSWSACQDADVLLESPSAMAGVHIAEALDIPYIRTFTMPWTKTTEFPHALLSAPVDSPTFNSTSYILFSNVIWAATSRQINRWRKKTLHLEATEMGHAAQSKIDFIYNFSKAVVPKPLDWPEHVSISGYWFLDRSEHSWSPSEDLKAWMAKAKEDGIPIVYIGFGSITVPNPRRVTAHIYRAVVQSGVRAIITKGWSSRLKARDKDEGPDIEPPQECFVMDSIPHDWLFPRVQAALHHGGAGTTGASLRAGIPTLIKPWFGDQFFWASRVNKLGAGVKVPSLRVKDMADALIRGTCDTVMKERAARVGERIRAENGIHTAIWTIYGYLRRTRGKGSGVGTAC